MDTTVKHMKKTTSTDSHDRIGVSLIEEEVQIIIFWAHSKSLDSLLSYSNSYAEDFQTFYYIKI